MSERQKTQKELFEESTREAFEAIDQAWNGHIFQVPDYSFGEGYVTFSGFEEMYMRHCWVKKGEITEEQKQLMFEHNRLLLDKLKEMGWQEPDESLFPNPESIY